MQEIKTQSQLFHHWNRTLGINFSRRFRLLLARHTWGKSPNVPVDSSYEDIGPRTIILMNDLLTEQAYHDAIRARAMLFRQEYFRVCNLAHSGARMAHVSTNNELIKGQEALAHALQHGVPSLEPASPFEERALLLAENR